MFYQACRWMFALNIFYALTDILRLVFDQATPLTPYLMVFSLAAAFVLYRTMCDLDKADDFLA